MTSVLKQVCVQMAHIGTVLFSWLQGRQVGTDAFGNRYYQGKSQKLDRYGRERRWVVFKGEVEASKVPPEWHAWLHHIAAAPLTRWCGAGRGRSSTSPTFPAPRTPTGRRGTISAAASAPRRPATTRRGRPSRPGRPHRTIGNNGKEHQDGGA